MQIRPVSDLRNKFPEIEKIVSESQEPVILTKNGYGSMVLLSLDMYENLTKTTTNTTKEQTQTDYKSTIADIASFYD